MLAKRTRMALALGLALGGAGVVGAQRAEAAGSCGDHWERIHSYTTGLPTVSVYINDVWRVTATNCGPDSDLTVDVDNYPDQCIGFVRDGHTLVKEIKVTYQNMPPWNAPPPKPRGVKPGC